MTNEVTATELLDGRAVTVIGTGLVGAGWAIAFARAGANVRLYDAQHGAAEQARRWAASQLDEMAATGLVQAPEAI
ncbi:3-hydroxyacyl-CoA dehydrogenase NAD-binding domain-containing protein [Massilia putida]|uniref:3-hydroxyacyl-CoA dehydrogenase NAD-binding domain-containing protein n=1 Tax=Massilia putida TaxID=1141883 RepID=UPI000951E5DA|nr:3-hydroxyacyl-CoA dehydrogenase NAD-binding domain-containing protein [Massilia putida]